MTARQRFARLTRPRRFLVLSTLCLVLLVGPWSQQQASAHAVVTGMEPADGSVLTEAPAHVVVTFSEAIVDSGLEVDVTGGAGPPPPIPEVTVDRDDPRQAQITFGAMPDGAYQVRLTARDAVDLHQVVARTSFGIGEAPPPASPPDPASFDPWESIARWLFLSGFGLLIGVLAVRDRADIPPDHPRRLHTVTVVGAVLLLSGWIGALGTQMMSLSGDRWEAARSVLATGDARRLLIVALALGCVLLSLRAAPRGWSDVAVFPDHRLTWRRLLGWTGALGLAVLAAAGGHSTTQADPTGVMVAAKTAHLLGLGLWVGVLAVVLLVSGAADRRASLATMSRVALTGAGLAAMSGLVLASELVVSLTALAGTPYGRLLAAKTVVLLGAIVVGLAMRRTGYGRMAYAELGLLTVVVLLGAAMTSAAPATDAAYTTPTVTQPSVQPATVADDLLVRTRALPGHPGTNTVEIRIGQTRRPTPGPVTSVSVTVNGQQFTATPNAEGLAFIDGVLLPTGSTTVTTVVHRSGWPDTTAQVPVSTVTQVYRQPPWVSSAPIRTPLLLLAFALGVGGLFLLRPRWRLTAHLAPRRRVS